MNIASLTLILGGALLFCTISSAQAQDASAPQAQNPPAKAENAPTVATDPVVQQTFELLMGAIEDADYGAFVLCGDEAFKAALNREIFAGAVAEHAARLKRGHRDLYLGEMRKSGFVVHLWRVRFGGEEDDSLAELSLKNGKVGGFYLR